jgi:3-deoxy-7-phosphoheptulonate synthase
VIPTSDLRIAATRPLISPAILEYELPMSLAARELVAATRLAASEILRGADPRLLVVVGPCSIHDPAAALEYATRLSPLIHQHADELLIVMRVYFEKPRTTVGWKGLINDPHLDDSFDINQGLRLARNLLLDLAALGVPAGTEFLDTILPQYYADLIAWGAIGARTTECQLHRELASGLSMPVGFKNGTGGSIQIALDAIRAAAQPHRFLGVTKQGLSAIVSTTGNTDCHLILRGGQSGPNYSEPQTAEAVAMLRETGLHPRLMIDCSHGNSCKDFRRQPGIAAELAQRIAAGEREIAAIMIESNLVEGSQKHSPDRSQLVHGCSITDACIGWDSTLTVLDSLAAAVRQRKIHA